MKHVSIRRTATVSLLYCLLSGSALTSAAQQDGVNGPPKVLVIEREYLKPGKGGSAHERSESAFVRAMTDAKSTNHYFALDSLSGPSRSLFLFGYDSFADWEKEDKAVQNDATLSAALDHAYIDDGELLSEFDQSAFVLRPDLSYNTGNLTGKRYMEITQFVVKPGHTQDFEAFASLYLKGTKKAKLDTSFTTFQLMYGSNTGNVFLVITPLKSLADTDKAIGFDAQLAKAMGPIDMKRFHDLSTIATESEMTNLFAINPKMSYPPDEWIKAEPDFWQPKPDATPAQQPPATPSN